MLRREPDPSGPQPPSATRCPMRTTDVLPHRDLPRWLRFSLASPISKSPAPKRPEHPAGFRAKWFSFHADCYRRSTPWAATLRAPVLAFLFWTSGIPVSQWLFIRISSPRQPIHVEWQHPALASGDLQKSWYTVHLQEPGHPSFIPDP